MPALHGNPLTGGGTDGTGLLGGVATGGGGVTRGVSAALGRALGLGVGELLAVTDGEGGASGVVPGEPVGTAFEHAARSRRHAIHARRRGPGSAVNSGGS